MTTLIPEKDVEIIKALFTEELKNPVKLSIFVEPAATLSVPGRPPTFNKECKQLMEELASFSDKITLEVIDPGQQADIAEKFGVDKTPAVVIDSVANNHNVRFYGLPGGREFPNLLQGIVMASQGKSGLAANTKLALAKIDKDIQVQVFTTPTCPYCPPLASMAIAMAQENPHIKAEIVEISEFPHVATKYQIQGVPTVILSDVLMFVGAVPEENFIDAINQAYDKLRAPSLEIPKSGIGLELPGQQQHPKRKPPETGGSSGLIIAR